MAAEERPIVACYEPPEAGVLVHRPMTDEELADYNERLAVDLEREDTEVAPLLAVVEQLTPAERARLRELLDV